MRDFFSLLLRSVPLGVLSVASFIANFSIVSAQGTYNPPPTFQSGTPQNLEVYSVDSSRVELTWDAVVGGWITAGYYIYRCDGVGCSPMERIGEVASPEVSYVDSSNIISGQTYGYSVTAYNNLSPDSESAKSLTVYAVTSLLPVPMGLVSSSPLPTQIRLSWNPVDYPGLSGYRVYRCSTGQGCSPTELIGVTDTSTTVYADSNLSPGGYMYAVSSYNGSDESAQSTALSAHTRQYYSASDFTVLVSDWLKAGQGITSDLNGDGVVNTFDIGVMMNFWSGT